MATNQHDNDELGNAGDRTRMDRIARQAQDAGEAVAQRGRPQAASRAALLRSPRRSREAANRAADAANAAQTAGQRAVEAHKRAAAAHHDAANAHDHAAQAAERQGHINQAIEHRKAAARDRAAARGDLRAAEKQQSIQFSASTPPGVLATDIA